MAKDKLTDYDSAAANNLDVGGISVAEGMLPSGVNNAIREQMSHLADFAAGTSGVDVLKLQDDTDTNSIKLQAPSSVTTTTTFTLPDGDGASGQTMITDGAGTLSWAAPYGNRNLIINGAMQVAQRGTSFSSVTSTAYHLDRFQTLLSGLGTWTISQSNTAPTGFSNSLKYECTTADASPASGDYLVIYHKFEGQNLQHLKKGTANAESVTLSFWVRSNKTGTYNVNLNDDTNIRLIGGTYSISSADTWEYKTITYSGDTTGAFNSDNNLSLIVEWWLGSGTDWSSGTSPSSWESRDNTDRNASGTVNLADTIGNTFYITGVQLELGSQATPFEHRSYGDELARCQRYYSTSYNYGVSAGTTSATQGSIYKTMDATTSYGSENFSFPVKMRTNPTMTSYSPTSGTSGKFDTNTAGPVSDRDMIFVSTGHFGSAGLANNQSVGATAFMRFQYTADAEL